MSYQVLARKWRPQNFSQVVGQPHVLTALSNGLAQNRVHHAYLFSGTRGVGKTTIARILAKSLNCEQGVTATPCGKCENCVAIDQGRFVDLLEIDAASRTKVDDTRELLDNVQYKPAVGRYKVYLIDEVHMLSKHSFNALLKTLEEPPEYVKFLLATTDPQKLPITVLSRCLQFHLKAILPEQIEAQLEHILHKEKATFEHQALNIIAKAADGSMRDALSLTDQALAFGAGNIEYQSVLKMLGTLDNSHLQYLLHFIASGNVTKVFQKIEEFVALGADFAKLHQELSGLCHQIALQQLQRNTTAIEKSAIQLLSERLSPEEVQLYYQIALEGYKDYRYAPNGKVALEMTVMRLLAFKPANYIELDENLLTNQNTNELTPAEPQVAQQSEQSIANTPVIEPIVNEPPAHEPSTYETQVEQSPVQQAITPEETTKPVDSNADFVAPIESHTVATSEENQAMNEEYNAFSEPPESQEERQVNVQAIPEQAEVIAEQPAQVTPQQSISEITSSRNMLRSHRLKRNEVKKLQATTNTDHVNDEPVVAVSPVQESVTTEHSSLNKSSVNVATETMAVPPSVEKPQISAHDVPEVTPAPMPTENFQSSQFEDQFEPSFNEQFDDSYEDSYRGNDYEPYIPPEEMQPVATSTLEPDVQKETFEVEATPAVEPLTQQSYQSLPATEHIDLTPKRTDEVNGSPVGHHAFFSDQQVESVEVDKAKYVEDKLTDPWSLAIQQMQLHGLTKLLAKNCVMKKVENQIVLTLKPEQQHLLNNGSLCEELQMQLKNYYGPQYSMYIEVGKVEGELTAFESEEALFEQYLNNAKRAIVEDENIKNLVNNCGAKVYENSVIPL
mgnify:CR=1 FL=1